MHHKRMKFHMMRGFKRSNAFIWTLPSALYFSSSVFWFGFFSSAVMLFLTFLAWTRVHLLAQFNAMPKRPCPCHWCKSCYQQILDITRCCCTKPTPYTHMLCVIVKIGNSKNIKENENEPFLPWFCNSFRFLHHGIIIWAVSTVNASN